MLFTAKGVASLLVPLGNVLTIATGSWAIVFATLGSLDILAALIAVLLVKPMRTRLMAESADA
jgi:OFA family oxalate/formate antiporter-like MFS transporter